MAIVHIAMFDAVNAIVARYEAILAFESSATSNVDAGGDRSIGSRRARGGIPSQRQRFDELLDGDLSDIPDRRASGTGWCSVGKVRLR